MYVNIFKSPFRKTTQILTSSMTHCMQKPINSAWHRRLMKILSRPLGRKKKLHILFFKEHLSRQNILNAIAANL
jgi:hypothetical protein